MHAAVDCGLTANAVDVAKRDTTGILKAELRQILEHAIQSQDREMSEDDRGYAPPSQEENALSQLDR